MKTSQSSKLIRILNNISTLLTNKTKNKRRNRTLTGQSPMEFERRANCAQGKFYSLPQYKRADVVSIKRIKKTSLFLSTTNEVAYDDSLS